MYVVCIDYEVQIDVVCVCVCVCACVHLIFNQMLSRALLFYEHLPVIIHVGVQISSKKRVFQENHQQVRQLDPKQLPQLQLQGQ